MFDKILLEVSFSRATRDCFAILKTICCYSTILFVINSKKIKKFNSNQYDIYKNN